MLDKEVFFKNMDNLLMAFPNWKLDVRDVETMKFWYTVFRSFDNARFAYMVDQYINNEQYNPTIGGLKQHDTMPRKTRDQIEHEKMLAGEIE